MKGLFWFVWTFVTILGGKQLSNIYVERGSEWDGWSIALSWYWIMLSPYLVALAQHWANRRRAAGRRPSPPLHPLGRHPLWDRDLDHLP